MEYSPPDRPRRATRAATTVLLAVARRRGEHAAGRMMIETGLFDEVGIAPPDGRPGWLDYLERTVRGQQRLAFMDEQGAVYDETIIRGGTSLVLTRSRFLPRRAPGGGCSRPRARRAVRRGTTRGSPDDPSDGDEPGEARHHLILEGGRA